MNVAGHVLRERDETCPHERDGHCLEAHAPASRAAGGVGGADQTGMSLFPELEQFIRAHR